LNFTKVVFLLNFLNVYYGGHIETGHALEAQKSKVYFYYCNTFHVSYAQTSAEMAK
jgi:hypothetical protein